MSIPTYPTIVTRSVKGSPLTTAEMDSNWLNTKAYALTLANLIAGALNTDGTLVAGSVGANALQDAAVTLAALNPALLYSIVPVDADAGTSVNQYVITAKGGLGGSNLVPDGATYDANGNYVVTGLVQNYGYYWTKGTNDFSVVINAATNLSASGAFTAITTSVTLTGQANGAVNATLIKAAPIAQYTNGQFFWISTTRANTDTATLNVNNIGEIPILLNGDSLPASTIQANSVFGVVYMNGAFTLVSGAGSASTSSTNGYPNVNISYSVDNTSSYNSGNLPLPANGVSLSLSHGFSTVPTAVNIALLKTAADGTSYGVGEYLPISAFTKSTGVAGFIVNYDSSAVTVTNVSGGTIYVNGVAITNTSWVLLVKATKVTPLSNVMLPELKFYSRSANGAFSYQNNIFVANFTNYLLTNYNPVTNAVTAMAAATSGTLQNINATLIRRADNTIQAIMQSRDGIYILPALNPGANIVPYGATYGSAGEYTLAVTTGGYYKWTIGANDISYNNGSDITSSPSNFTAAGATVTLKGTPNTIITASVITLQSSGGAALAWKPTRIGTAGSYGQKPVKFTESAGSITEVYAVNSNPDASGALNAMSMVKYSGTNLATTTTIGSSVNFASGTINNISEILSFYSASTNVKPFLFQWNPIKNRIYIASPDGPGLHIYQLATGNDLVTWWSTTSGSPAAPDYTKLTYLKTIGLNFKFDVTYWSDFHMCIEWDQNTGDELCIVVTTAQTDNANTGNKYGCVNRIPWVEGA